MYPFIESSTVWGFDIKQYMTCFRSEDWYGIRGYKVKAKGNMKKALRDKNAWNPALRALIREGDTVIDCGANEGYTTVLFAKQVGPKGRVIAIEGNPVNIPVIQKNLEINGLTNVSIVHKVLSDKSGEKITFGDEMVNTRAGSVTLETITLDDFAHDKPNVIKIDIEGYELPALRGAEKVLAQGARLEVEMHLSPGTGVHMTKAFGFDPFDIIRLLKKHRYEILYKGQPLPDGVVHENCLYCLPPTEDNTELKAWLAKVNH